MSRTTEIIILDSLYLMPSFKRMEELPRDKTLKIVFKENTQSKRENGQIIEVCFYFGEEFCDLDPFFFSRYIRSTTSYSPLPVEIYEDHADGTRIIEKMLELGRFEKINKNEIHHPGVVVADKEKNSLSNPQKKTINSAKPGFSFWKFIGLR